jgi:hypothetical protein
MLLTPVANMSTLLVLPASSYRFLLKVIRLSYSNLLSPPVIATLPATSYTSTVSGYCYWSATCYSHRLWQVATGSAQQIRLPVTSAGYGCWLHLPVTAAG